MPYYKYVIILQLYQCDKLNNKHKIYETLFERYDKQNRERYCKTPFCDDEFSDIDIELIEYVVSKYGNKTAKQLVKYTHNKNSAWYKAASENGLIELFNSGRANHSNIEVDLTRYLSGCNSQLYAENKEVMDAFNMLKK